MKKKLLKSTVVAALLSSSILVFAPNVFATSDNVVDQSIHSLKIELHKAATQYINPSLEGKLASSGSLNITLNNAKKSYETTRNSIVLSKLSVKEKESKLNEIDVLYQEKITKGLVSYIDAYNYATKYLDPILTEIREAEERADFAAVEKGYHKLSYQLKDRTAILYRFSGKAARDLLLEKYKKPADVKRDELMLPVTIYMKLAIITDLYNAGKKDKALQAFEEITTLVDSLSKAGPNMYTAVLLEEVEQVRALVDPLLHALSDRKVEALVDALNASQGKYLTASSTAANSLVLTIKEDISIVEFLGQGFYTPFISNLGISKVNGKDPLSVAAIADLKKVFPSEVKTLADLKGKTITLPLTINNGTEMDINFAITFQ
ncbi:hypothetical protein [Bacillus sp. FJAT-22090]|uniref:hypothetical protein n=1 Tax=Bacillus sp. FJAT-22090 TaxID=1581038 RepID=UPI0011A5923D|nr:hypothetical protein [Bacillus sp. FJAT-22090]